MSGPTEKTTRRKIADALRERPATPSGLAAEFGVSASAALEHVQHLSRTLESTEEELLVRPPTCRECGFDAFDDLLNRPSRCPECNAESIEEPAFRID